LKKKITPKLIADAKDLSLKGFSHTQIMKCTGISRTAFYADANLLNTIYKSEAELRKKISDAPVSKIEDGSETSIIYLAKRLSLFHTSYVMPQIKSTKTALEQISRINSDLASGILPPELATSLIKNIEVFLKAFDASELEQRLTALEEIKESNSNYSRKGLG